MPLLPIYRDFFRFLEVLETVEDPWEAYQQQYIRPNRAFFGAYWQSFPLFDERTLRGRVLQIKQGHYMVLEHLLAQIKPEEIVTESLSRCHALLPAIPEPDVFLMVGFFSADGFIVQVKGRPVIGIGLERFKDFRLLGLILAHEYCHYARRLILGAAVEQTLGQKLLAEGLSVVFSQRAFPDRRLTDHLFMPPERLSWCRQNEAFLEALARPELGSCQMVPAFFLHGRPDAHIPPRTGMYLGYRLVQRALQERGEGGFEELLKAADIAAVWPTDGPVSEDGRGERG